MVVLFTDIICKCVLRTVSESTIHHIRADDGANPPWTISMITMYNYDVFLVL